MKHIIDFVNSVINVLFFEGNSIPLPSFIHYAAEIVTEALTAENFPLHIPHVNLYDHNLALAIIAAALPPLMWNIIGPFEYYTKIPSRLSVRPIIGVYLSGTIIAALSVLRSALFLVAIRGQEKLAYFDSPMFHAAAGFLTICGLSMFLGAYYRLGIRGTYLDDCFGLLMEHKITAFPFSVCNKPMYDGSTLMHLGEAILECSPTGILLSVWLFFCYRFGCILEEPFTAKMYAKRDTRREAERLQKLSQAKTS